MPPPINPVINPIYQQADDAYWADNARKFGQPDPHGVRNLGVTPYGTDGGTQRVWMDPGSRVIYGNGPRPATATVPVAPLTYHTIHTETAGQPLPPSQMLPVLEQNSQQNFADYARGVAATVMQQYRQRAGK